MFTSKKDFRQQKTVGSSEDAEQVACLPTSRRVISTNHFAMSCPVDHSQAQEKPKNECPVDHKTQNTQRSIWSRLFSSPEPSTSAPTSTLSTAREVSSIPKGDDGNWVYPSEAQFFAAMARKNHDPQARDMKTIVPIHNAVNERAWAELMKWETGRGGEACGGVKLVTFKGRPDEKSPRARWKMLLG
jgi:cytochrome c heme-lyase